MLVQITSKLNDGLSIIINDKDCLNPLPLKSYIRPHKVFTVHQSLIISKLTVLNAHFLKEISNKIYELIEVS